MKIFRLDTSHWHITRVVFLLAGLFALTSVALATLLSQPWWLAVTAFVGVMQVVFALTGYCPSAMLLQKFGVPEK